MQQALGILWKSRGKLRCWIRARAAVGYAAAVLRASNCAAGCLGGPRDVLWLPPARRSLLHLRCDGAAGSSYPTGVFAASCSAVSLLVQLSDVLPRAGASNCVDRGQRDRSRRSSHLRRATRRCHFVCAVRWASRVILAARGGMRRRRGAAGAVVGAAAQFPAASLGSHATQLRILSDHLRCAAC